MITVFLLNTPTSDVENSVSSRLLLTPLSPIACERIASSVVTFARDQILLDCGEGSVVTTFVFIFLKVSL